MIEKIQLTSFLVFMVSWFFISFMKDNQPSTFVKASVLFFWLSSGLTGLVLTLYKIWN